MRMAKSYTVVRYSCTLDHTRSDKAQLSRGGWQVHVVGAGQ